MKETLGDAAMLHVFKCYILWAVFSVSKHDGDSVKIP